MELHIGVMKCSISAVRARRSHSPSIASPVAPAPADRHLHNRRQGVLDMLGVSAEFETNPRRERQLIDTVVRPWADKSRTVLGAVVIENRGWSA
jgi:hypothetical protein